MGLKTLGPKEAAELDKELMSESGGFSIDQLMELAGLSVSQAVYKIHPPSKGKNILIACGPGNNGGDGLVAARHLHAYGYTPKIYYPKPSKPDLFTRLQRQLKNLSIPFLDPQDSTTNIPHEVANADLIVDALFGFSFRPPVREPFGELIGILEGPGRGSVDGSGGGGGGSGAKRPKILAVDIPSSWDVESGPPESGQVGHHFMPEHLISLTAPKPCVRFWTGERHFVGGRFVPQGVAERFGLEGVMGRYEGCEQVFEVVEREEEVQGPQNGGKL